MTDKQFYSKLDEMLDEIFAEADRQEIGPSALAEAAGIGRTTLYALDMHITRQPRLSTVVKLAEALGMEVTVVRAKNLGRRAG